MLSILIAAPMLGILVNPVALDKERQAANEPAALWLHALLLQPISIDEGFPQGTTFKDGLGYLCERYKLTILIDEEAYKEELNIDDLANRQVRLPPLRDVPLRDIMRMLCEQVQGAAIQIKAIIWVVPKKQALNRLLTQEIDVNLDKVPLVVALK